MNRYTTLAAIICLSMAGVEGAETDNLAAGKPVRFLPEPDYALTAKGGTDATDLTDGVFTSRKDDKLWFDSKCVGFSYPGLQQLWLDLGAEKSVGEFAIRLQGGSPSAGSSFPVWVDLVASRDGKQFYRVASFSRWNPGDRERFGIPPEEGKAWVHRLAFRNLRMRARYVGLSFYGTGLNVTDELWVLRGPDNAPPLREDPAHAVPFCADGAQIHFHKPVVWFSTNIPTPNPVGILTTLSRKAPVTLQLDLPPGVQLLDTRIKFEQQTLADGWSRHTLTTNNVTSTKIWQRLYLSANWPDGQEGELRYQVSWKGGQAPPGRQRIRAVRINPAPQPKRLLTGLGWWDLRATARWPDAMRVFQALGFSYVPLFARHVKDEAEWKLLDEFRAKGFKVVNVDSPLHVMEDRNKRNPEIRCQLPGGPGQKLCPSYRGPAYRAEIERLASEAAKARPDLFTGDIELWGWRGPLDAAKCSRCKADFAQSGLKDLQEWQIAKGCEMWKEIAAAVRKASQAAGGPATECGGYDFRPGKAYQFLWSVDRLYPDWMHGSEVSTYTALEPHHIALVGDEVRKDRQLLKRSDVIPWISPGDAGVFPGWAFRDALLECFANGARGMLFWSSRVWDTETLSAYADAVRIVAPVEDVIMGGELLTGVKTEPAVRVSGVRKGDAMFLLVADYHGKTRGAPVTVTLPVTRPARVVDLATGVEVARLKPGASSFKAPLACPGARAFAIR
ncbi:MAG: hypothetical protein FJ395_10315 [Verrucomicrobia bacterium]|nr:hypothetical protein [Verrucomicrobiota bacterium]